MTGLIIGKFCPPHRGHKLLIDTARDKVDELTVLVCVSAGDPISADQRFSWLRQIHPDVSFLPLYPDSFDRNDAHAWVSATLDIIHEKPDWVFSSEDYGVLYAELLGCQHYMVDKERLAVPCSAKEILRDPVRYSRFLEPVVAASLIG